MSAEAKVARHDDLIFDIGMDRGDDTDFYLRKGFRVVAVEADAQTCSQARGRFADAVAAGRLTIVNTAIAARAGPVRFFRFPGQTYLGTTRSDWALKLQRSGHTAEAIMMEGVRLADLCRIYGVPHYLKIDIEGADTDALRSLLELRTRPRYVSLESSRTSWHEVLDEFRLLRELGFHRFKIVPQHDIARQSCPFPAREGTFVDQAIRSGMSGLFGAELPGEWSSARRAKRQRGIQLIEGRLFGDEGWLRAIKGRASRLVPPVIARRMRSGWHDVHASE